MTAEEPGLALDPTAIGRLTPEELDRWLERLEARVPTFERLVHLAPGGATNVLVFGDTHGDWRSTQEVVREFRAEAARMLLLGLGAYIDRPPADCPNGSALNALLLLGLAAETPGRVILLQGNHETARRVGVQPHQLGEELRALWGPSPSRYGRVMGLLERGPYAALSPSGVYFAHAGFPDRSLREDPGLGFSASGEELLFDVVWRDAALSDIDRGTSPPFGESDLHRFLDRAGAQLFLRGHDPTIAGRWIYGDRCLTLHTTRIYERYGGVLRARVPLDRPVRSRDDLEVAHLATEGRSFPSG